MLALLLAAAQAAPAAPATKGPSEIVAAAPASEWVAIAPDDLLVMELAPDATARPRRVVIQLMPPPFSQGWVANIHTLAKARWWNGTSVNRVQDNYVVQWGDASEKKPLPPGLKKVPESGYEQSRSPDLREPFERARRSDLQAVEAALKTASGQQRVDAITSTLPKDPYAREARHWRGWQIATDNENYWPVHCYGSVGVGRNLSPDTGTGAELYAVIGHAPRHLDRNIAVVGRVVEGIEHLSSLPRGTAPLGFYETAAERTPIRSVRLASDLPEAERPRFQYLSTEGASFAAYADARANRRDAFFIRPAGGADICNVPVPVRRAS